jgi:hypothetical protein
MTNTDDAPLVKEIKNVPSAMEKLVEIRFLVLMTTLVLYTDIWLLRNGVDPRAWTFATVTEHAKAVPILTGVVFVLIYSALMVGLFPFTRLFIGRLRLLCFSNSHVYEDRDADAKRLSDWSLAFVALSIYDLKLGYFSGFETYKGLTLLITSFLQADPFEISVLRVSAIGLAFVIAAMAFDIDN